jgi:Tfp pilus assembly protein PilO
VALAEGQRQIRAELAKMQAEFRAELATLKTDMGEVKGTLQEILRRLPAPPAKA